MIPVFSKRPYDRWPAHAANLQSSQSGSAEDVVTLVRKKYHVLRCPPSCSRPAAAASPARLSMATPPLACRCVHRHGPRRATTHRDVAARARRRRGGRAKLVGLRRRDACRRSGRRGRQDSRASAGRRSGTAWNTRLAVSVESLEGRREAGGGGTGPSPSTREGIGQSSSRRGGWGLAAPWCCLPVFVEMGEGWGGWGVGGF